MWLTHKHQRFWVSRHRQQGAVVYDPNLEPKGRQGPVTLFIVAREELIRFNRAAMKTRSVWIRIGNTEARKALESYLHARQSGHANKRGQASQNGRVPHAWQLPNGKWGVRIPKHMATTELVPGMKVRSRNHLGKMRVVTLERRIQRTEYGEIWSTSRSELPSTVRRKKHMERQPGKLPQPRVVHEPTAPGTRFPPVTARGRGRRLRRG